MHRSRNNKFAMVDIYEGGEMDKVVVVTGAGGVLGSTIARAFAKEGARVLVSDINDASLGELANQINKGPGKAIAWRADIRDNYQVEGMIHEAIKNWKRIDIIACVGGQSLQRISKEKKAKLLIEHTDEDWDLVMETNLKGTFQCIKAAAKPMMAQKDGHIIIMGSNLGSKGGSKVSSYSTAKAGLYGLMKAAAIELGEYNIKVNVVNPGRVLHPGDVLKERDLQESTLKMINDESEVADFFVYLSGMKNVSGQILNLDSRILF